MLAWRSQIRALTSILGLVHLSNLDGSLTRRLCFVGYCKLPGGLIEVLTSILGLAHLPSLGGSLTRRLWFMGYCRLPGGSVGINYMLWWLLAFCEATSLLGLPLYSLNYVYIYIFIIHSLINK